MMLLLPLLGASCVKAIPMVFRNEATCSVITSPEGTLNYYTVTIGRPWGDGSGSIPISKTLASSVKGGIFDFLCSTPDPEIEQGLHTKLTFATKAGHKKTVISVVDSLQEAYPTVPFQERRICLMDGVKAPKSWPSPKDKRDPGFFHDLKDWFLDITNSIGLTEPVPDEKRDLSLHKRDPGFFHDLKDWFLSITDAIGFTKDVPDEKRDLTKRGHICDGKGPSGCDYQPANYTCLMTTGCHDDWIPANDSAICFYRVGWYDVRIGKPHLNCSGAAYIREMLRDTLPVGELTSLSGDDVDFQCYEGPNNTTKLAIGVPHVYGEDVNRGLDFAYPGVGFDLNICPICKDVIDVSWAGASCRK